MTTAIAKRQPRAFRPFEPLQTIRDEFEGLWNRLVDERRPGWFAQQLVPAMDLTETGKMLEVSMDLPGFDADDINVQIGNNVLTVSGKRDEECKEEGVTRHCIERRSGTFSRSFVLPAPVKEEDVDARFRNGVLSVSLHKYDESKGRQIKVQR